MSRKNEKETLTGLIALSADENNHKGKCISDEELALLIEERMDGGQQKICMEHLAHCERCYNEWFFLKNKAESQRKKRLPLLPKSSYKYIGSSLALAASVVVFLNVYNPPLVEVVPVPEDSVIVHEKSDNRLESFSGISEERDRDAVQGVEQIEMAPAPVIKMQKNTSRGKAERKVLKKESLKPEVQNQIVESAAPARKLSGQARTVGAGTSLTIDALYRMILDGCKKEKFDPQYWSNLSDQGAKIFTTSPPDTLVYSHLLALLESMEQETWQQQCDELSQLLAEEVSPINGK